MDVQLNTTRFFDASFPTSCAHYPMQHWVMYISIICTSVFILFSFETIVVYLEQWRVSKQTAEEAMSMAGTDVMHNLVPQDTPGYVRSDTQIYIGNSAQLLKTLKSLK